MFMVSGILMLSSCGLEHEHVFSEQVVDATCESAGVIKFTCDECGESYEEEIPALGHNYVNGVCSGCQIKISVGFEYNITENGKYEISSIGTCADTKLVIHNTNQGADVIGIGAEVFKDNKTLTSITLPKTLEYVIFFDNE